MYNNKDFKLKLIFPCKFETYAPYYSFDSYYMPYGIGILTAFLRKYKYHIEQEDLAIKFNYYKKASSITSIFQNNITLDISSNNKEINDFFKSGKIKGNLDSFIEGILDLINIEEFNIVGLSILSLLQFIFALMLAKKIRQRTNATIVFGGSCISLYGLLYPEAFNFIDYIIVGDGRIPLLKLIDYLQGKTAVSEIPNLLYRDNDKIITNPREYYLLEDIPLPDFDGLPLNLYKRPQFGYSYTGVLPYQISRGCIDRCSFCNNQDINRRLEFKSYNKVLSELIQMKERYRSKVFRFCDDAINNSYEYLEKLCDMFIKNKLDIKWDVFAKIGNLDKYILRKMKKAGCRWLIFGIESGSDSILRSMNKGFTAEQASQTLKEAAEAGIRNSIELISGYLYETQEDTKKTITFIRKNKKYINNALIHSFGLTYNNPIYFNPEKYGVTNLRPSHRRYFFAFDESRGLKWEQKREQQEKSWSQIRKAVYNNASFTGKFRFFSYWFFYYLNILLLKFKKSAKVSRKEYADRS